MPFGKHFWKHIQQFKILGKFLMDLARAVMCFVPKWNNKMHCFVHSTGVKGKA